MAFLSKIKIWSLGERSQNLQNQRIKSAWYISKKESLPHDWGCWDLKPGQTGPWRISDWHLRRKQDQKLTSKIYKAMKMSWVLAVFIWPLFYFQGSFPKNRETHRLGQAHVVTTHMSTQPTSSPQALATHASCIRQPCVPRLSGKTGTEISGHPNAALCSGCPSHLTSGHDWATIRHMQVKVCPSLPVSIA